MTYSVKDGSVDISTGVLFYHQGTGSGDRAINTAFTADAFNVSTNWQMEFDWGASSANTNASNVAFATNQGTAFTISWASYATTVTITDANSNELTTTLPIDGYNKATMTNLSHFTITGDTENGIYLTVTNGTTTYVDNVLVSSTFGYPKTFNGSLGRAVSHMALDNIAFKIPAVAGFVPAPSSTLTGAAGTARKFTLSCTEVDATIYYSETEKTAADDGWTEYTAEVTTDAATIYAIAKKGSDVSEVYSFATGAGTEISLNVPAIAASNLVANGDVYNAVFTASYNASGVQFEPAATLSATFTPDGGAAAVVTLPYTVTEKGTLTVTASAEGFASAQAEAVVYADYEQAWQSLDFSSLVGLEAVQEALGEGWTLQESHSRWASWDKNKEGSYNFYQHGNAGTSTITINENIAMREVVLLAEGMGLGRNVTGGEAVSVKNTSKGDIVAFEVYNGYGKDINKGTNTYLSYVMSDGTSNPSVSTTNGALMVQATVYAPVKHMSIVGDFSENAWDTTKGIEMTRDAEDSYLWTATIEKFNAEAKTYEYKAIANQNWDDYVLPSGDNANFTFGTEAYPAGLYNLTFTVNTKNHTLTLVAVDASEYTIVGCYNNDATASFFGTAWDVNNADNTLTRNDDGTYTKTFNSVALEAGTILYKVVKNHSWDTSWGFNSNNADYGVNAAGVYDITFTFNPTTTLSNGFNLSCDVTAVPTIVSKTITDAGYATYSSNYALDFSTATGLTAYIAKKDAENNVTFEVVTKVPANTGVLLKGEAGEYTINTTAEAVGAIEDNVLVGVTAETQVAAGAFVLMNGAEGVGFYRTTKAFTVGANTAYIPAQASARAFIGFNGNTTGIEAVAAQQANGTIYNLQGQRVSSVQKGLYIVNGKKFFNK